MFTPDPRDEARAQAGDPVRSAAEAKRVRLAETPDIYRNILHEIRGARFAELQHNAPFHEAWLLLSLFLSAAGLVLNNPSLTAASLFMFLIALSTWLWNRLSLFGLHYKRRFSHQRAFVGETIDLTLTVRNQKFLPLTWITITDQFAVGLPLCDQEIVLNRTTNKGEFITFWMTGPFQRLERHFQITCAQRGFHHYGPARLNSGDAFGFFSAQAIQQDEATVIVYPQLYTAADLNLPAKNPFGPLVAPRRLIEDPLRTVGIRNWQPQDTIRRIHWKATARHQTLLSRAYEPSEEQQVLIFLNVATMRRHWQGHFPKLMERVISVAGTLASLSLESRIPTGLIANGRLPGSDQALRILPSRSPDQLTAILELLAAVTPFASLPIEHLLLQEAPRLPWGATLVVVSGVVPEDLMVSLLELDQAGRKVVLFCLAEKPPEPWPSHNLQIYHVPHLVDDLLQPLEVTP